jgi:uncharacterized OsmC-like protein
LLVIRRIHVKLNLKADEKYRETAGRIHSVFADNCPIYRSLYKAIVMTTELVFEPLS